mmetsp:Transcript_5445/g.14231  ORF Transcript_5445/g.14231 Transcript_5445/m.14231 type:complete len:213 (+) Transcript_5445:31-669(+)
MQSEPGAHMHAIVSRQSIGDAELASAIAYPSALLALNLQADCRLRARSSSTPALAPRAALTARIIAARPNADLGGGDARAGSLPERLGAARWSASPRKAVTGSAAGAPLAHFSRMCDITSQQSHAGLACLGCPLELGSPGGSYSGSTVSSGGSSAALPSASTSVPSASCLEWREEGLSWSRTRRLRSFSAKGGGCALSTKHQAHANPPGRRQ